MAKKKHTIKGVKVDRKTDRVKVEINIDFDKTAKRVNRAQYLVDMQVMASMVPFMPKRDGLFIATTRLMSNAIAGTGEVVAAAPPFGRFLYEGKVMVDPATGSPWARKGAKKVVTGRPLTYTKAHNRKAQDHWFDAAKKKDLRKWLEIVDDTVN